MAVIQNEFDVLEFSSDEIENQFARVTRMNDEDKRNHRLVIAGRLDSGYFQLGAEVMQMRIYVSERGPEETHLDYFYRIENQLNEPIIPMYTMIESVIIYVAFGIRCSDLTRALLLGYRNRSMNDGLRQCILECIYSYELRLLTHRLPLWANLVENDQTVHCENEFIDR